jgi:hypothetical protein
MHVFTFVRMYVCRQVLQELLGAGACWTLADGKGHTPLDAATQTHNTHVAAILKVCVCVCVFVCAYTICVCGDG